MATGPRIAPPVDENLARQHWSDLAHKQVGSEKAMSVPRKHRAAPNPKETAMTDFATDKREEMTSDELDRVVGGIIIVGGLQRQFTSALDQVALNPQPLPPRIFSYGH
jgi:hypothetical protein